MARQMVGQGWAMSGRGEEEQQLATPKVFRGMRYVRGYGAVQNILGSIGRFLLPIAKNVAQSAQQEAVGALGGVATDLASGRAVGETIKDRGSTAVRTLGTRLQQCGRGSKTKNFRHSKELLRDLATMEIGHNQKPTSKLRGSGSGLPPSTHLSMKRKRLRRPDYFDMN